jgi:DNA-binding transcriptional LysR family regulator
LYALEDEVRSLREEVEGRVSVVSIYSIGLSHMNRCVQDFLNQHPQANVRVEYQHPQQVVELVKSGQMDLGLISYPKQTRELKAIPWRDETMVVVCAPSHPLAGSKSLTLEQLDGQELVGFDEGLQIRREIDRVLSAKGVSVRVVMEFDNIETLKRAVEINAGLSLLPEPTVAREVEFGSLVAVPLANVKMVRPLGILHRCGADLGATARRFIQFLLDYPKVDEWSGDAAARLGRPEGPATRGPDAGRAEPVPT